jgi:hypothetical protein
MLATLIVGIASVVVLVLLGVYKPGKNVFE